MKSYHQKADTVTCYTCRQRKPRDAFPRPGAKTCTACAENDVARARKHERYRERYQRDREAILAGNADWKQQNRLAYREQQRAYAKQQREQKRDQVIAHLGGGCACCGETEPLFLQIDHVAGNGGAHRRQIGKTDMWDWMIRAGFPEGFQLLCANCNTGKHRNGGVCPHEQAKALGQ